MRKKERYEKVIAWFQENVPVAETELHYNNSAFVQGFPDAGSPCGHYTGSGFRIYPKCVISE